MAMTVHPHNDSVVTPQQLIEWAVRNVDPLDEQSIVGASEMLYSLHNNRSFLVDALCRELKLPEGESSRQVSPQSIIFGQEGPFRIRANIWSPAEAPSARSQIH